MFSLPLEDCHSCDTSGERNGEKVDLRKKEMEKDEKAPTDNVFTKSAEKKG